ncbi:MAG: MBL fold metallo-hydrolase [Clostridia bacterium]|nr:MBL fold metallo-hydrolase [Clostridia bacterium]
MRLTWLGTAGFLLEDAGFPIALDPFLGLPHPEAGGPAREKFRTAQAVFLTHGHLDHILDVPGLYRDSCARIYTTPAPAGYLLSAGIPKERVHLIRPGDTVSEGPFEIDAYASRHCAFDAGLVLQTACRPAFFAHPRRAFRILKLHRSLPEAGETLFYQIRCGKTRIAAMGSLNLRDDVAYPTGADALLLPFQGRSRINEYAMPFVGRLKPQRVILHHWDDTFPPLSGRIETGEFCSAVRQRFSIRCEAAGFNRPVDIG